MDPGSLSVAIQDQPGFATVVCAHDGTLTGTSFTSTFRACTTLVDPATGEDDGVSSITRNVDLAKAS